MNITYPHKIENGHGETLIFQGLIREADGDRVYGENFVAPGSGPPMHVHWLQDEGFTVVRGKIGYQIQGQPEQYAAEGDTIVFKRGEAHRFWNAGTETLHCKAWLKPANTIVYFLTAIFNAQKKTGTTKPEVFDVAYLLTRYASEYDMLEIPRLVRKVVIPIVYRLGRLLNKYEHFREAPAAIQATDHTL
ncbi:cupin domain-containing protein [Larkinella sp. VNQ87]|uniref:cupin domain-containing protein n=1 Tax=Larkinella sp. VNQ87 TaxID=3400921 RepID=UPI003C057402